ncbi:MAG: GAF domain-containing protein [Anaerolineae bacterium]|nr:GAF domain-containing protein [Anaerolineae bacterium]
MTGKLPRRDLTRAIAEARQGIMMLNTQAETGRVDLTYLRRRTEKFTALLDDLESELKEAQAQTRLAALYEASHDLGTTLDLQTVLEQVMDSVVELTRAERGFVMLLNDDGELEYRVARNLDQEAIASGDFAVSRTITRQVVDRDEPILTTNAAEDPRFAQQKSVVVHNLRSIMATPLRALGRVIGVVYVDNRVRQSMFTKDDLMVLDAFAQQAAIAIENARLFTTTDQQLARRVEELRRLRLIDRRLSETLDLDKVMQITLEWAARVTGARSASIGLRDDNDDEEESEDAAFNVVAHYNPDGALPSGALDRETWDARHPLAGRVLKSGKPVHMNLNGAWYLGIPLTRERRTIGIIALAKDSAFDADAEEVEFVIRLANRAAVIIENARLYKAVIAAKQATDEFVSVASHELKTPMVSIRGYADMMTQGLAGEVTDQQKRFLSIIARNVQRLEAIVSDLTDVSRIETGHIYIEIGQVDVEDVIEQTRDSTLTQIEERGHTLIINMPPDLPYVKADPKRVMQVMNNLVSNAYKYTPDGGTLTISCRRLRDDGDWVEIAVSDTGVGMSEEELKNLGRKFWRADNEHVTAQKGTGLGFAITKSLIELMEGKLSVKSEVGVGSTFAFALPVA